MSPASPRPATSRVRISFMASPGRRRVGQQRHLAGVLDRLGDLSLLLGGYAGDPAGPDLAAVGDELAEQVRVLVVDVADLGRGERVLLLLGFANGWLCHVRGSPGLSERILLLSARCDAPWASKIARGERVRRAVRPRSRRRWTLGPPPAAARRGRASPRAPTSRPPRRPRSHAAFG